jgi:hypothetical protein
MKALLTDISVRGLTYLNRRHLSRSAAKASAGRLAAVRYRTHQAREVIRLSGYRQTVPCEPRVMKLAPPSAGLLFCYIALRERVGEKLKDFLEVLSKYGTELAAIWPALAAIIAFTGACVWGFCSLLSNSQIEALKAQIAERDARVATIDERLKLAQDKQKAAADAQVEAERRLSSLEQSMKSDASTKDPQGNLRAAADRLFAKELNEISNVKFFIGQSKDANNAAKVEVSEIRDLVAHLESFEKLAKLLKKK